MKVLIWLVSPVHSMLSPLTNTFEACPVPEDFLQREQ